MVCSDLNGKTACTSRCKCFTTMEFPSGFKVLSKGTGALISVNIGTKPIKCVPSRRMMSFTSSLMEVLMRSDNFVTWGAMPGFAREAVEGSTEAVDEEEAALAA